MQVITCEVYICELCRHTRNTWQYPPELPWNKPGDRPPPLPQQYFCTWCESRIKGMGFHNSFIPDTHESPAYKHPDYKSKWDPLDPAETAQILRTDCDCGWKDSWKKLLPYSFPDGRQVFVSRQGRPDESVLGIDGCRKCWGTGTILQQIVNKDDNK